MTTSFTVGLFKKSKKTKNKDLTPIDYETLHANDSVLKQLLDTFRDHPDIGLEADRRTKEILDRYQKERKLQCD